MTHSTPQAVELYQIYPRRADKPAALRAIQKALDINDFEFLKEKTTAFAQRVAKVGKDKQHIPYPATWFNREGYNEDLDDVLPMPSVNGHTRTIPAHVRLRTAQDMLEAKRVLLSRTVAPEPSMYQNPDGERFKRDREAAIAKRATIKNEIAELRTKIEAIQREIV